MQLLVSQSTLCYTNTHALNTMISATVHYLNSYKQCWLIPLTTDTQGLHVFTLVSLEFYLAIFKKDL